MDDIYEVSPDKLWTEIGLNVKKARERLTNISKKEWKQAEEKSYKYREIIENYHGISQRWLIIESEKRKESDQEIKAGFVLSKNRKKHLKMLF